jgi:high-affinity nickel permease
MDTTVIFSQQKLRRKCIVTMGGLAFVNILVWILAGIVARRYPELLGSMVVAYTLGLRHAVDADHLAAIDNVTRKLIYQGMVAQAQRLAIQKQKDITKDDNEDANQEQDLEEKTPLKVDEDEWTPPVCVGLFFSLGHSTIVIAASIALAVTATAIKDKFDAFGATGGIIGTSISASFLFLIGFINLVVLIQVGRELRRVKRTGEYHYQDPVKEMIDAAAEHSNKTHPDLEANEEKNKTTIAVDGASSQDEIKSLKDGNNGIGSVDDKDRDSKDRDSKDGLEKEEAPPSKSKFQHGGLFARLFRPLFNLIDRSWKMYPLGVLFGLGFDTATEVGLLGIAATNAQAGFPTVVILIFPALFTAGMSLIDTLDGILMVNAYGWAFVNPVKKLWYNFIVTLMGVLVAFVVGFAELLGLLGDQLNLQGPFWDFFGMLNDNFGLIGYIIVGLFVLTWAFAVLFYKYGPMKDLERRVVIVA